MIALAVEAASVLLAVFFIVAGSAMLLGHRFMIEDFDRIGFGQSFRFLTGAVEILGGIGLLVPRLAPYSAAILCVAMVGAAAARVIRLKENPTPPLLLLVALAIIGYARLP